MNLFRYFIWISISVTIIFIGCHVKSSNDADLNLLVASSKRLIEENKFDSATIIIDSLKLIATDTSFLKIIRNDFHNKKKNAEKVQGTYYFIRDGFKFKIVLGENGKSSLFSTLNGQEIKGVNSLGVYTIANDSTIKVNWEKIEFNKNMGELKYDSNSNTIRISNGTIYKKYSSDIDLNNDLKIENSIEINSHKETVKTNKVKSTEAKRSKSKKLVMFCGEQYEDGTDFERALPYDYKDRAGLYCLKNYREGASDVYYSGFNNAGILVTAVGEVTGVKHIILFMCNGGLY